MKKNIFTNILIFRPVMLFFLPPPPSIYALKQKSIEIFVLKQKFHRK